MDLCKPPVLGASVIGETNFCRRIKKTEVGQNYVRSGSEKGTDEHRQEGKKTY